MEDCHCSWCCTPPAAGAQAMPVSLSQLSLPLPAAALADPMIAKCGLIVLHDGRALHPARLALEVLPSKLVSRACRSVRDQIVLLIHISLSHLPVKRHTASMQAHAAPGCRAGQQGVTNLRAAPAFTRTSIDRLAVRRLLHVLRFTGGEAVR